MIEPRRIWHVNIIVRELDRSLAFYRDVIGLKVKEAPFTHEGPTLKGVSLGSGAYSVDKEDIKIRAAFLGCTDDPDEVFIDLTEFLRPPAIGSPQAALNEVGIGRVAFFVDDIDGKYQELEAAGVKFVTEPVALMPDDDRLVETRTGKGYFCCFDPDGIILEFYGNKKAS
jgi:catechol 2,3-dioxygenase-like lactoylglutathione lyase family enzyme